MEKYFKKEALACFASVKPSASKKTLSSVSQDLFELVQAFKDNDEIAAMHTYRQLKRVLAEQCKLTASEAGVEVTVKPPKEVTANSLQNPSDPDAGYSGHKGQGYQVQLMETYRRTDSSADKAKDLKLITYVKVASANALDTDALIPALKSTKKRGLIPKEVLADSLYGSDENTQAAKAIGVELISPAIGKTAEDALSLTDFEFAKTGEITRCPAGQTPLTTNHKKNRYTTAFNKECCSACANSTKCPVKEGAKACYLRYSEKQLRLAKRRQAETKPEFRVRYRYRAGIEASMSYYDRKTGVKRLRVRGLPAVRYCATLKATGVNIFRATAVRAAEICLNLAPEGKISAFSNIILIFKEQIGRFLNQMQQIFGQLHADYKFELKIPT